MTEATLPTDVEELAQRARDIKQSLVSSRGITANVDLHPMLDVRRGDYTVGVITCPEIDRDQALQAAMLAVPGWAADYFCMILDATVAGAAFQGRFGDRMPDPGELQELIGTDLVTEALVLVEAWRNGRQRHTSLPYVIDRKRQKVRWSVGVPYGTFDSQEDGQEVEGRVPDVLRRAFTIPTIAEALAKEGVDPREFGLDPEGPELQIHQDLATMQILAKAGFGVAFNAPTTLHREMLEQTFEESAGLLAIGPDGVIRESKGAPSLMDLLSDAMRERLADERLLSHEEDMAERDRRRNARFESVLKENEET